METLDILKLEKNNSSSELVSQEEMDVELKKMQEAVTESRVISQKEAPDDQERLKAVRRNLKEIADSKTPEERSRDEAVMIASMKEAMIPDWKKRDGNNIDSPNDVPPEEPPKNDNESKDGNNEDNGSISMDTMHTKYEYDPCPSCGGTGRKWFIFPCFSCGGTGNILASTNTEWSTKEIPLKDKTEQPQGEQAESQQEEKLPENSQIIKPSPTNLDGHRLPDEKKPII